MAIPNNKALDDEQQEPRLPGMIAPDFDDHALEPPLDGPPVLPLPPARVSKSKTNTAMADSVIVKDSPIEQEPEVPDEIKAQFRTEELDDAEGDMFNDLGKHFPRDKSGLVTDNDDLIARVNAYNYSTPALSYCKAYAYTVLSCGCYYYNKRRTIPAGYFGHYTSMGRHMLAPAGRRVLMSSEESWEEDEPVDDEKTPIREIGTKYIIVVPENHVAGAFRIGGAGGEGGGQQSDGDFVLLAQGRHVLDSSCYREVKVKKLEDDQVRLGPLTILYIKEGYVGGAYERVTGVYRIFHPGPPYLLHDKDFEAIELKERKLDGFKVGPITFLTVKDGEMAGAYRKSSGQYQLLPPGNTYQLHEKEFEGIDLVQRSNLFKLGPYTFITVQKGFIAGAYKQRGGDFVILPPGQTYQLNENEYKSPEMIKRDRHVVSCGPLTFLTLQEGYLMGAYRTADGKFEEFNVAEGDTNEFVLHDRDYHGLVVVNKYSREVQEFGPNKIVTIPEGMSGVFEREGSIEIVEPGFYRVSAEYYIRESIPLHVNSERFDAFVVRTKDSIRIKISMVIVWRVKEALLTAKWPGELSELKTEFRSKSTSALVTLLRGHTRAELLPTRQDVLSSEGQAGQEDEADIEAKVREAAKASKEVQTDTEDSLKQLMNRASEDGGWGLEVVSAKLDSMELGDEQIIADMQAIAQTQLNMKRKMMEGRAELAAANVERESEIQKQKTRADIKQAQAQAEADVKVAQAKAQSEISLMESTNAARAQAEAKKIELEMQLQLEESQAQLEESKATRSARAEAEAKKIELEMQKHTAETQVAIEETKLRAKQLAAETEAASVKAMAEANYDKGRKEQEVSAMMSSQELELKRLELCVEGMKHFAGAAWRHPEDAQRAHMHLFWEEMKPFMRLGPMTAAQMKDAQQQALERTTVDPAPRSLPPSGVWQTKVVDA